MCLDVHVQEDLVIMIGLLLNCPMVGKEKTINYILEQENSMKKKYMEQKFVYLIEKPVKKFRDHYSLALRMEKFVKLQIMIIILTLAKFYLEKKLLHLPLKKSKKSLKEFKELEVDVN
jgi:hypothetical protein